MKDAGPTDPTLICVVCGAVLPDERPSLICDDCTRAGRWTTVRSVSEASDHNVAYWLAKEAREPKPWPPLLRCMPDGSFAPDTPQSRRIAAFHAGEDLSGADVEPQYKSNFKR